MRSLEKVERVHHWDQESTTFDINDQADRDIDTSVTESIQV